MGDLNCSFSANISGSFTANFQPPKANVDDHSCAGISILPPAVQVYVWQGKLSNEMSVSVVALTKLALGGESTVANKNKKNLDNEQNAHEAVQEEGHQAMIMIQPLIMIRTGKGRRSADATEGKGRCRQHKLMFSLINMS
ncbi:hypothetical protein BTVI_02746 [Pitangus sulphuratus]|nr:hypothetical protein BTVI_02746 [Pitangus sulphuratus]